MDDIDRPTSCGSANLARAAGSRPAEWSATSIRACRSTHAHPEPVSARGPTSAVSDLPLAPIRLSCGARTIASQPVSHMLSAHLTLKPGQLSAPAEHLDSVVPIAPRSRDPFADRIDNFQKQTGRCAVDCRTRITSEPGAVKPGHDGTNK